MLWLMTYPRERLSADSLWAPTQTRSCISWRSSQLFNITQPPNVTRTLACSKPWFISHFLWTRCRLFPVMSPSTWYVTTTNYINVFILISMKPFLAVQCNTLGYDSSYLLFFVDGVSTSDSATGDAKFIPRLHWPQTVTIVATGITQTIVQCFLIHRYWKMSVIFVFISQNGPLLKAHSDL